MVEVLVLTVDALQPAVAFAVRVDPIFKPLEDFFIVFAFLFAPKAAKRPRNTMPPQS